MLIEHGADAEFGERFGTCRPDTSDELDVGRETYRVAAGFRFTIRAHGRSLGICVLDCPSVVLRHAPGSSYFVPGDCTH